MNFGDTKIQPSADTISDSFFNLLDRIWFKPDDGSHVFKVPVILKKKHIMFYCCLRD